MRSEYTNHLTRLGLNDTYHEFVYHRAPRQALPMWTVAPSPLPAADHIDSWIGEQAARWIETADGRQPFFLWVGFAGPHNPWDAPIDFVDQYRDADIEPDSTHRPRVPADGPLKPFLETLLRYSDSATLTDERTIEVRRHYFANVTLIDAAVGRILDALRGRGMDGDTWVIYSTDHGEMLGTHGLFTKMVFYEPSVRVPLIIRPPAGGPARRFAGLVEHVDLTATLIELAGAKPLPDAPGRSLTDSGATGRDVVVSENFGFGPDENHDLIGDPGHVGLAEELMRTHVTPFLRGDRR